MSPCLPPSQVRLVEGSLKNGWIFVEQPKHKSSLNKLFLKSAISFGISWWLSFLVSLRGRQQVDLTRLESLRVFKLLSSISIAIVKAKLFALQISDAFLFIFSWSQSSSFHFPVRLDAKCLRLATIFKVMTSIAVALRRVARAMPQLIAEIAICQIW